MKNKIIRSYNSYFNLQENAVFNQIINKYKPSKEEKTIIKKNLNKIINAFKNFNKKLNILLYGAVQSGKTKYLLFLAHLAFEYKYNFVIYISGNKNSLHEQNLKDFQQSFKNKTNVKFISCTEKNLDLRQDYKNQNIILFVKKIKKDMTQLKHLITERNFDKYNFLIIDDECDNATPNNKENNELSLVNKVITKLSLKSNVIYLGTTGTPYHNLIMKDHPKPDKVIVLENSKNYKGLKYFKNIKFWKKISLKKGERTKLIEKVLYDFIDDSINNPKTKNPQLIINIDYIQKEINEIYNRVQDLLKSYQANAYWTNKNKNLDFVERIRVNKLVSLAPSQKEKFIYSKPNINIGCFMISRGFRFNDLTHVLIYTKTKKLALDTYVQRCRWFGYQNWDVKIYANEDLITLYTKVAPKVDEEIRNIFIKNENLNNETNELLNRILKKHNINNIGVLSGKRI